MTLNYRWVNGTLDLEYQAVIANGHTGHIASSTGAQGQDVLHQNLGLGEPWKGKTITLTIRVRKNPASGALKALVVVTVWQSDPNGGLSGRFNEQTIQEERDFDENGFADFTVVITFD